MPVRTVTLRLDKDLTEEAVRALQNDHMDLSAAVQRFLEESVAVSGIPFDLRREVPNDETLQAIWDTLHGVNLSREFHSVRELMEELNSDDKPED